MLEYIQSRPLSSCNSIKTFDFSTLHTTIPHNKLKDKLRVGATVFHHSDSTKKFSETDIFNMLEFLIDNIFVMLSGRVFNIQSAHLWVQTVFLFSAACSFICMRQISYRSFSRKTKRSYPDHLISRSAI